MPVVSNARCPTEQIIARLTDDPRIEKESGAEVALCDAMSLFIQEVESVVLGNMASAMIPRACFFEKERVTRMPTPGPDATATTIRLTVISGSSET